MWSLSSQFFGVTLLTYNLTSTIKIHFKGPGRFSGIAGKPEIMEKTENFIKVTIYLTKLKEILINHVWEKSHLKKTLRITFSVDSGFSNELYGKK